MLNTKYVIVADPSNNQQVVQTNPGALGPAWFVSNIKFVNNATEEIRALDHMDPKDSAVVEKKEQPKISLPIQADTTATIKLVENRNDQISYTSQSRTTNSVSSAKCTIPMVGLLLLMEKNRPSSR